MNGLKVQLVHALEQLTQLHQPNTAKARRPTPTVKSSGTTTKSPGTRFSPGREMLNQYQPFRYHQESNPHILRYSLLSWRIPSPGFEGVVAPNGLEVEPDSSTSEEERYGYDNQKP